MVTLPSSRGWRSTSRVERRNSGSSSRKRTPWWARLTSPGRGMVPPPMRPTSEMVWWGERKGRRGTRAWPGFSQPHDAVDLGGLERLVELQGGRMVGRRRASMVLPAPGGPIIRTLWPPAAATSRARFAGSCPLTSPKSSP